MLIAKQVFAEGSRIGTAMIKWTGNRNGLIHWGMPVTDQSGRLWDRRLGVQMLPDRDREILAFRRTGLARVVRDGCTCLWEWPERASCDNNLKKFLDISRQE
jgi:hypothetical protein